MEHGPKSLRSSMLQLEPVVFRRSPHCEERSDEAIQESSGAYVPLDRVASLAMTVTLPFERAMF
jgi:hypothetical protein